MRIGGKAIEIAKHKLLRFRTEGGAKQTFNYDEAKSGKN